MKVKTAIKNLEVLKSSYESAVNRANSNMLEGNKLVAAKYVNLATGILFQINKLESAELN